MENNILRTHEYDIICSFRWDTKGWVTNLVKFPFNRTTESVNDANTMEVT
jgi:hypothetical protein